MRHETNTTCSWRRGNYPGQPVSACTPELYVGHEKSGILFVRHCEDVDCPHLRSYSYGDFCVSIERIEEYLRRDADALRTDKFVLAA